MGLGIPPREIKILLESNPLQSRILIRRLAVQYDTMTFGACARASPTAALRAAGERLWKEITPLTTIFVQYLRFSPASAYLLYKYEFKHISVIDETFIVELPGPQAACGGASPPSSSDDEPSGASTWDHTNPPHPHHPLFNKLQLDLLNVTTHLTHTHTHN